MDFCFHTYTCLVAVTVTLGFDAIDVRNRFRYWCKGWIGIIEILQKWFFINGSTFFFRGWGFSVKILIAGLDIGGSVRSVGSRPFWGVILLCKFNNYECSRGRGGMTIWIRVCICIPLIKDMLGAIWNQYESYW